MKHQYRSANHADSEPRIGLMRSAVQAVGLSLFETSVLVVALTAILLFTGILY